MYIFYIFSCESNFYKSLEKACARVRALCRLSLLSKSNELSYQGVRKQSVEFSFQVSFDIVARNVFIYMLYFS